VPQTNVADVHLRRLQSVQDAAARLVSGARRHDHITPILATLHWLPVRERVTFKTAVMVWKCLHDVAPRYLVDLRVPTALQPVVVSHVLRCLGLSWYPGPGHRPANASSLSMPPEPGTDYRQPFDCQNCHYLHSSASSRPTSSSVLVMVALWNRADHYIFILSFVVVVLLLSSFFFSSPNLSRRRLDVYHTSAHGVVLV